MTDRCLWQSYEFESQWLMEDEWITQQFMKLTEPTINNIQKSEQDVQQY